MIPSRHPGDLQGASLCDVPLFPGYLQTTLLQPVLDGLCIGELGLRHLQQLCHQLPGLPLKFIALFFQLEQNGFHPLRLPGQLSTVPHPVVLVAANQPQFGHGAGFTLRLPDAGDLPELIIALLHQFQERLPAPVAGGDHKPPILRCPDSQRLLESHQQDIFGKLRNIGERVKIAGISVQQVYVYVFDLFPASGVRI